MAYTFDAANANKPSTHTTQYFEMMGVHAIYHDGWVAATTPVRPPWELTGAAMTDPANGFKWELYNISKDWTENNNLAASNPQKLKEMQDLFWVEARKYQVLPLDASVDAFRSAAAEHHGGPHGVQLHHARDWHPVGRRSQPTQHVLHHNR